MARIAREVVPDFPHHVVQRGARRMDVFFSADDRQDYLGLLPQSASKRSSDFFAWCLMNNHAHFVVAPRQSKSLSATFGEAHRRYTRMVNSREGRRGHLWQERFHSYPMDERHLVAGVRYVEMNPVRAGLVQKPEDWEWSSARYHLRTGRPLGAADFVEKLERFIGTSLRPKQGGWQKGKKRK